MKIRRAAPNQGMSVSLADIMIVHIVVFGHPMASDLPFATAGEMIREARPNDWRDLMTTSMCERLRNDKTMSYEQLAALVKAIHGGAK
jgi:hypothetical protein